MRKVMPWALVCVLGVGIAVAAVVGQIQSPAASSTNWLASLLETTAASGSAHLRISAVTLSTDPFERSSSVATGAIDFTTGNFRFVQVNHQTSFTSTNGAAPQPVPYNWSETVVALGQSLYEKDDVTLAGRATPLPTSWNKYINPRNVHQAFGLGAGTIAENAVSGVSGILPVASVRSSGPATVNGVSTTRYVVTYGAPRLCGSRSFAISRSGGHFVAEQFEPLIRPSTVWVDGQGRLVQIRASTVSSAHALGAVGGSFDAAQTSVTTLTFSDFGAPVHVVAPKFAGPNPRSFSVGGKPSSEC